MDFSFAEQKLSEFSSNPSKVHFEYLVELLRYIKDNKTLGLNYYSDMNDALLSYLLREDIMKTGNKFMDFYYSSSQYCPDTGRNTGAYTIFFQGGPIDHGTYVPVPVDQSSAESEYNAPCSAVMSSANFRVLIHNFL